MCIRDSSRFNMANKYLGRKLISNAEKLQIIPSEQTGGRKHHQANVTCTCKTLFWDITRQKRTPAALSSNDATSCYDRMLFIIGQCCGERFGAHPAPLTCLFTTMFLLVTCVLTAYGMSRMKYGGITEAIPLHTIGQGNGYGPTMWTSLDLSLIHI